jgi:hypothetical protein
MCCIWPSLRIVASLGQLGLVYVEYLLTGETKEVHAERPENYSDSRLEDA